MRFFRTCSALFVVLLLVGMNEAPVLGQPAASSLTVDRIMQDPDTWVGGWPSEVRWHESGEALFFHWNPNGEFPSDSLFRVAADGGDLRKVAPAERREAIPFFTGWQHGTHTYTSTFQEKVYADGGDLYVYDRRRDRQTRLTDTRSPEQSPRFSPDGRRVIFERDGNLFALNRSTGLLRQLTDLRAGTEPSDNEDTPQEAFLKEQQTALFQTLREAQETEDKAETQAERDRQADDPPAPVYTGDMQVRQLQIDPTERFVSFTLMKEAADADPTTMTDYVTETGFAETLEARPKVGHEPGSFELHVQDLERDTAYAIDLHQLPGAYEVPAYRDVDSAEMDSSETKRALYSYGPYWSADGSYAILVVRSDDNKDRWIARLDPVTGALQTLDRQHDEAWIGGPGIGAYGGAGTVGWMPDGERFFFQSEATGYSHLYTVNARTGSVTQLTSGEWTVEDPQLSRDGSTWIFRSNRRSPHQWHVEQMDADGGAITRLTAEAGSYTPAAHPDFDRLAVLYAAVNRPPDVYLQDAEEEADAERITESPTEAWSEYDWRTPEVISFEASDGVDVPAHLFRPENPNGAAVLFVHGAGYTQNVVNDWTHYFREYMFHNLLTDLGYTVLNVDYRGSKGYGRDWRTAIYRHMGGRDLQDYVDAVDYLEQEHGISGDRSFIYGGSYGGFLTLMGLFTEPDSFAGGAALRSVTDWAHYNDVYTSNILNTPQTDSLAYARSSPIYFAEGLEDPLLMPHGLVDTNVQPQDIFRLTQRLIELGKEDWELALYPVEGHGFEHPSSWKDEYRRIFTLIESTVGAGALEQEAVPAE